MSSMSVAPPDGARTHHRQDERLLNISDDSSTGNRPPLCRTPTDPMFLHPRLVEHARNASDVSSISSLSVERGSRSQPPANPARNSPFDYYHRDESLIDPYDTRFHSLSYQERVLAQSRSDAYSQATYSSSSSMESPIPRAPSASPNYAPHMFWLYGSPMSVSSSRSQLAVPPLAHQRTQDHHTLHVLDGMGFRPPRRPHQHYHPAPLPARSPSSFDGYYPDDPVVYESVGTGESIGSVNSAIEELGHQTAHRSGMVRGTTSQICQLGGILGYLGGLFWKSHGHALESIVLAEDGPVESEMRCPICAEIMKDPVIDKDGYSYERKAILQCLESDKRSPITREPLVESDLRPNRALKAVIQQYLQQKEADT